MNSKIKHTLFNILPERMQFDYSHMMRMKKIGQCKSLPISSYEGYLSQSYKKITGFDMNFDNPQTLTQKQQWMKLYDQSQLKCEYSDKYVVRKHIAEVIGEEYLIPLIVNNGKDHFFSADEIDFDKLPNQFVLKCSHGSGYVIVVSDKSKLTNNKIKLIKHKLDCWLKEDFAYYNGFELVYTGVKPCIIIEKYMAINDDLSDYKFLCFSGEVKYVWCDEGRFIDHKRSVFDLNYQLMPFTFYTYGEITHKDKPENFEQMLSIAKSLCGDFAFSRVDLYSVNGEVYFGELTFSSSSGYELPYPIEYDRILGDLVKIDLTKRERDKKYRE